MAIHAEVHSDPTGAVLVQRADTEDDARRLRSEGARLQTATHPGVVQVVRSTGDDHGWELHTRHGGRPLDASVSHAPELVAAIVAAIASTLADLHALGVVHGRLRAAHVLLAPSGRPVLWGFGPDPALDGDDRALPTPADDVGAIGAMLVELLSDDPDGDPIPERRWRRRPSWSGWSRRALLTLADHACAEPPTRRPTARRLAAAITEAIPLAAGSSQVDPPASTPPEPSDPMEALRASSLRDDADEAQRTRRVAGRVVVGLIAAIVLGAGFVRSGTSSGTTALRRTFPLDAPAPTRSSLPPTTRSAPVGATTPPTSPPPCAPDRPGQACTGVVQVVGRVITVDGRSYEVGREGDQPAVADWDCDGSPDVALLRPSTGELFVFSRWSTDDEVVVRPARTIRGAVAIDGPLSTQGCSQLRVVLSDGSLATVGLQGAA